MDPKSRRQTGVLVVLLAILGAALWWNLQPAVDTPAVARNRASGSTRASAARQAAEVERVRLDALSAPRPEPTGGRRDPFRFTPPPPPPEPPPPPSAADEPGGPDNPDHPGGEAALPPIPLRFIGLIGESADRRMAVLSDGNNVFYGREGDIIEGRYRIVRIRLESIEMAYADGRGHQVVRRSGS